jgi:hypothetical protein
MRNRLLNKLCRWHSKAGNRRIKGNNRRKANRRKANRLNKDNNRRPRHNLPLWLMTFTNSWGSTLPKRQCTRFGKAEFRICL